jgi:hypothetical protein
MYCLAFIIKLTILNILFTNLFFLFYNNDLVYFIRNEIKSYAPVHLKKVAFRLDEQMLEKHLQEVETQLISEGQSLQKGENVAKITQEHVEFFTRTALVEKIEGCLSNLSILASQCHEQDPGLQESYDIYKNRWDSIKSRMENIFGQLEQIPEQWKVYELKFREMSDWMDTVERSLEKVFKGVSTHEGFLNEKQVFQVTLTFLTNIYKVTFKAILGKCKIRAIVRFLTKI